MACVTEGSKERLLLLFLVFHSVSSGCGFTGGCPIAGCRRQSIARARCLCAGEAGEVLEDLVNCVSQREGGRVPVR